MPFGRVVAAVDARQAQEAWVGVDEETEFIFLADAQELERVRR